MRAAPTPPVLAALPTPLGQRRRYASCCRDLQPKSYQIDFGAGSLCSYESLLYKAVRIGPPGGTSVLIHSIDPRKRPISGVLVASASCGKPDTACRTAALEIGEGACCF